MSEDASLVDWICYQISDTNFPAGGLGNSLGLESALSHGFVQKGRESLQSFSLLILQQNASQIVPFVKSGYHCVQRRYFDHSAAINMNTNSATSNTDKMSDLCKLDQICHAMTLNESALRSSLNQGKCFLRAAKSAFEGFGRKHVTLNQFDSIIVDIYRVMDAFEANSEQGEKMRGHHPVIFGAICAALQVGMSKAIQLFMRCLVRDLVCCAVKLGMIGPLEGGNLQLDLSGSVVQMMADLEGVEEGSGDDDRYSAAFDGLFVSKMPTSITPLMDHIQARHDALYSRLFNS